MVTSGANMAHLVWERDGGRSVVLVAVHTSTSPSDAEWEAWVATLEQMNTRFSGQLSLVANLVLTDGGGPSQSQRSRVNTLIAVGNSAPPVAIVTDSRIVRTLVSGLSIFNPRLRVFPPNQASLATAHLGLPRDEVGPMLRRAVSVADRELGLGAVKTLRAVLGDLTKN
jgi:hypothetical protein